MKMSINVLSLQKKKKKILIVDKFNIYKQFLAKRQINLRDVTNFPKPFVSNFLWIFFDLKEKHFQFSTKLLPFDYFQSFLIQSKPLEHIFPNITAPSFRSDVINNASISLLDQHGIKDTFVILDKQDQFLRQEISINIQRKRRMLTTLIRDSKKKHMMSLGKFNSFYRFPVFKYLRRSLKSKKFFMYRTFFKPFRSKPKQVKNLNNKKTFVFRNVESDFYKRKKIGPIKSKSLRFKFYINKMLKNVSKFKRTHKLFFDFKRSTALFFNTKPLYVYTALNLYNSPLIKNQNRLKFLKGLKKLERFEFNLNSLFENFLKMFIFFQHAFKKVNITSNLYSVYFFYVKFFKFMRKFLSLLKMHGVNLGFYFDFYLVALRRSQLLFKSVVLSNYITQKSNVTVYAKKFVSNKRYRVLDKEVNSLKKKLFGLPFLGKQRFKVPSLFLGEKNEKEVQSLYSKSSSTIDNTMSIFYNPDLPLATKLKLIHRRLKRLSWEEAAPKINRWRLFNFNKNPRFDFIANQLLRFYSALSKKGIAKKIHLLKFYAKRKYYYSTFFVSYLGLRKNLNVNKTFPLNLHRLFLNSLRDFFTPLTKSQLFPGYFSDRSLFIKESQVIKPLRIVFSSYKEKRRSFQVHVLDSNNANLFTSWPGLVIRRISSVVGYHQAHKYTFLRFMKPKQAKRNFLAKVLTMRHTTNFIYKYFKQHGGLFELVIRTNFKLFSHRTNSRLLENIINTGHTNTLPHYFKRVQEQQYNKLLKSSGFLNTKGFGYTAERANNKKISSMSNNKLISTSKTNDFIRKGSTKYFRYLQIFFNYLSFIRKFTIFLFSFLIKHPTFFDLIQHAFSRLVYFQSVFRFFVKSTFVTFFSNRLLKLSSSFSENLFMVNRLKRFTFLKRRLKSGFFKTNSFMFISKVSMQRTVRHGFGLKHKKARRL